MRSAVLWGILTLSITATAGAQTPLTKTPTRFTGVYEIAVEDSAGPFSIRIIEWDRRLAPELKLIPAKGILGHHERLAVHEATSVMARRYTSPEVETIAAINADFFNRRGEPTNRMMSQGHWILSHPERPARSVVSISPDGSLWTGQVSLATRLCSGESSDCRALVWNRAPSKGQASLLNAWFSDTLRANPQLRVYRIAAADTIYRADSRTEVSKKTTKTSQRSKRKKASSRATSSTLPSTSITRSDLGYGTTASAEVPLNPGALHQTVQLKLEALPFTEPILTTIPANQHYLVIHDSLGTSPVDLPRSIHSTWIGSPFWPVHVIGGGPQLLHRGHAVVDSMAVVEEVLPSFLITRHPRTAIGWNADQSKVWMVVVDGRQAHSVGMGLYELTNLFVRLGAYEAVNLDGGGSSTLVLDQTILNRPSDPTGERKVGNALMFIQHKTIQQKTTQKKTN